MIERSTSGTACLARPFWLGSGGALTWGSKGREVHLIWSAAEPRGGLSVATLTQAAHGDLAARSAFWSKLVDSGGDFVINLATALLILAVTIWLSGWVKQLVRAALGRARSRRGAADPTLQIFVAALARNVVLILGGIAVLQQLGVKTTSIIAAVSAASLAVGLAMQGALSNVAAGVMIFLFRPYRVGDIIETGGRIGRVRSLDLFVTELATLDNLKIVIPNSKVFGDVIVDHTTHESRRADVSFRLPAAVEVTAVLDRLRERLEADPRIRKTPPPLIEITGLTEAFTEVFVRPWTALDDYGAVKADVLLWTKLLSADPKAELPAPPTRADRQLSLN